MDTPGLGPNRTSSPRTLREVWRAGPPGQRVALGVVMAATAISLGYLAWSSMAGFPNRVLFATAVIVMVICSVVVMGWALLIDRPSDQAGIGPSPIGTLQSMDDWLFRSKALVPEGDPAAREMWASMPEPHRRDLQWMAASMAQLPQHPVDAIVVLALLKKRRRRLRQERPRRVVQTFVLLCVPWVLTLADLWPVPYLGVAAATGSVALGIVGHVLYRARWERQYRALVEARAAQLHHGG